MDLPAVAFHTRPNLPENELNIRSIQNRARSRDQFASTNDADFTAVQEPKVKFNKMPQGLRKETLNRQDTQPGRRGLMWILPSMASGQTQ
jgi:hypothetical protein